MSFFSLYAFFSSCFVLEIAYIFIWHMLKPRNLPGTPLPRIYHGLCSLEFTMDSAPRLNAP